MRSVRGVALDRHHVSPAWWMVAGVIVGTLMMDAVGYTAAKFKIRWGG